MIQHSLHNLRYTWNDEKPRARLCKQHTALPQWVLWGMLHFRKVESLQASFCYMRTVHIVPMGAHTPRKWVTCSVSVAKKVTCTQVGTTAFTGHCRRCANGKEFFFACLYGRPRFFFLCGTSTRAILAPDWWLVAVSLFWSGARPLSAFLFTCIHGFDNTSNQVLLFFVTPECEKSISVLSLICRQAWGSSFPAHLDCNYLCSLFLPSCSYPTPCTLSFNTAALVQPTPP